MVTAALLVRVEAKRGKENEAAQFLESALALVQEEPDTVAWFALQFGPATFGIFDAFPTTPPPGPSRGQGRRGAHGAGRRTLRRAPHISKVDILAAKLPG